MPVTPALESVRQEACHAFESSLDYRVRPGRPYLHSKNPVSSPSPGQKKAPRWCAQHQWMLCYKARAQVGNLIVVSDSIVWKGKLLAASTVRAAAWVLFWWEVSCSPGCPQAHHTDRKNLNSWSSCLYPSSPDYRHVTPHLASQYYFETIQVSSLSSPLYRSDWI